MLEIVLRQMLVAAHGGLDLFEHFLGLVELVVGQTEFVERLVCRNALQYLYYSFVPQTVTAQVKLFYFAF